MKYFVDIFHFRLQNYNKFCTFANFFEKKYIFMQFFTAFLLGLLTILDPCTLMTSITAIGYIDKEINNKRLVLTNGLMFVLGK